MWRPSGKPYHPPIILIIYLAKWDGFSGQTRMDQLHNSQPPVHGQVIGGGPCVYIITAWTIHRCWWWYQDRTPKTRRYVTNYKTQRQDRRFNIWLKSSFTATANSTNQTFNTWANSIIYLSSCIGPQWNNSYFKRWEDGQTIRYGSKG